MAVSSTTVTGDFAIASNNCGQVNAGASCQITVTFTPTVVGARTGTLSVVSGLTTLKSNLTGTGVPDIQVSSSSLNFGNIDIGGVSATQTVTFTNALPTTVALQPIALTGDYAETTTCGASLGPQATCAATLSFHPTTTGSRPGTLILAAANGTYGNATTTLAGNGVDFSLLFSPTSGTVIAGYNTSTTATLTSIAGFSSIVTISCVTNAPGSTCVPSITSGTLSSTISVPVTITTKAKYTVVGYGGFGGGLLLSLFGLGGGALLWTMRRRGRSTLLRACLMTLLLVGMGAWTTGCSGKLPDMNNPYTAAGSYTYTMTATDGFLTHTATFNLTVTEK